MKPAPEDIRYACVNAAVVVDGIPVSVQIGTVWHIENPVVRRHPNMFSDDARWAMNGRVDPNDDMVEQATANPGERRNLHRA